MIARIRRTTKAVKPRSFGGVNPRMPPKILTESVGTSIVE